MADTLKPVQGWQQAPPHSNTFASLELLLGRLSSQVLVMKLLVLCVTALLFGAIQGEGSDSSLQPKSLLELLKKDARELAELVKYHDNELNAGEENNQQSEIVEDKREIGDSHSTGFCNGKPTDDGYSLYCIECFFIRLLPGGYQPKVFNERKCMDQVCLKGFGKCLQQYTVVYSYLNGRKVSLSIPSGCKCGVQPGTAMYAYYP